MSRLAIYSEQGLATGEMTKDHHTIASKLMDIGVRFERWETNDTLSDDTRQEEVLSAYSDQVRTLADEFGFKSVDVVSLRPDNPKREELRSKFLAEHIHSDFEVRFFVAGAGLFYLHAGGQVFLVLCERGDLISVPANVTHWFDMGRTPDFTCIRLFTTLDGWLAQPTGSEIPSLFPDFDQFVRQG